MTTPRLLTVTSTWPLSRTDQRTPFVRNLNLDLAAAGWQVQVLAPHAPGAPGAEIDKGIAVERFRYMYPERCETLAYGAGGLVNLRKNGRLWLVPPFVAAEILATRGAIRRFRPDIIHAHWLLPQGFAAGLAAWGSGIPVVTTIHGGDVFGLSGRIYQPFKRIAIRRAARITVNGSVTAAAARQLGAAEAALTTIRFGPAFEGAVAAAEQSSWRATLPADAKILLFVGRLVPEKGADDFIRALAGQQTTRVVGVICGDGPDRGRLQALASELGLADRLRFEGWVDPAGIALRMTAADGLVFPSKRSPEGWVEAQGIVLVEAMRARLPVLAARSGGIPDLVEHGHTGWLFPEADVAALTRLIADLLADRLADLPQIVARAHTLATTEVTRARTASAFDALFHQLMRKP